MNSKCITPGQEIIDLELEAQLLAGSGEDEGPTLPPYEEERD